MNNKQHRPTADGHPWWAVSGVQIVCIFCGQRFGYSMQALREHFADKHGAVL